MISFRRILLIVLLLVNVVFLDFPGAKIIAYGVCLLIAANWIYVRIIGRKITVERLMESDRLFIGLDEKITLKVGCESFLPAHAVFVRDYSGHVLSSSANHNFVMTPGVSGVDTGEYVIRGRARGLYSIGPIQTQVDDLAGIFSYSADIPLKSEVLVFPHVKPISSFEFRSRQPYGSVRNRLPVFEDTTQLTGMREYIEGDEISRINWKTSAKQNKLIVNTYQPSISIGSAVILNLDFDDYPRRLRDENIEIGIGIASSFVKLLHDHHQDYLLATSGITPYGDRSNRTMTEYGSGEDHFNTVLSILALIEPSRVHALGGILSPAELNLRWGTNIIMVSPVLGDEYLPRMLEFQRRGHTILFVHFGPEIKPFHELAAVGIAAYYAEVSKGFVEMMRV
jgi:uncharacterized protein (DUF58 family)